MWLGGWVRGVRHVAGGMGAGGAPCGWGDGCGGATVRTCTGPLAAGARGAPPRTSRPVPESYVCVRCGVPGESPQALI